MSDNPEKEHITIDVVSDVMCPWCYIGKKRLEGAIADLADRVSVTVNWLPYQLDATLPKEGKNRKQYFIDKFGSLDRYAQIYQPIHDAGKAEGIPFKLDDIPVSPNTLDAHRLIHWAAQDHGAETQNKLVSILMQFFFEQARHIGEDETLLEAARLAGMDIDKIRAKLNSDEDKELISKQVSSIQQMGVSGVPFMIINKKYALQGAQEKESIIQVIQDIINEK